MAHFYGWVKGKARTPATRLGSKNSGLETVAASWNGAITVWIYEDTVRGPCFVVEQKMWEGNGINEELARGVIGQPVKKGKRDGEET